MKYNELNLKLRKILNSGDVVPYKLVRELKLPNTVMLKFIRGESEKLTLQTMERLLSGLGFQLEVKITNDKGEEIDIQRLEEAMKSIAGNERIKKGHDALSIVAGAKTQESAKQETVEPAKQETAEPVKQETAEPVKQETAEPEKIEIPDLDLDLGDIFTD